MTPVQLDVLLAQVIKARSRAEAAAREAEVAVKTLTDMQKQIEHALMRCE